MPVLTGRTAVVTGASGGIGLAIARALAARGAHVVLASRQADRGARAAVDIGQAVPGASTETAVLDLASLASVRRFAAGVSERHGRLDILVNNAGIAGGPRRETADGFEAHFGVNHLGHFALTGLLLGSLGPGSRVVTMSSGLAAQARIDFADLQSRRRYRMTAAYGQSKLAQLMFAVEVGRRLQSGRCRGLESFAAHPGAAQTRMMAGRRGEWGRGPGIAETAVRVTQVLFGAAPGDGSAALPVPQATDPGRRQLGVHRDEGAHARPSGAKWESRRPRLTRRRPRGSGRPRRSSPGSATTCCGRLPQAAASGRCLDRFGFVFVRRKIAASSAYPEAFYC